MKKLVKAILLIVWMGVIFFMSGQPQIESEITSNLVAELIYHVCAFLSGGSPMDLSVFLERYLQPIRKLAHFSEFMILGALVYSNLKEYAKKHLFVYALLFSSLYAVSDEFHQLFTEGRYCSLRDMLIDISGALTGILLSHLIARSCRKKETI